MSTDAPWKAPSENDLVLTLSASKRGGHQRIHLAAEAGEVPLGGHLRVIRRGQSLQITAILAEQNGSQFWQIASETIDSGN